MLFAVSDLEPGVLRVKMQGFAVITSTLRGWTVRAWGRVRQSFGLLQSATCVEAKTVFYNPLTGSVRPTSCLRSTSTASDGSPCDGADGPREERFQGQSAAKREIRPWAWIGSSSPPPRSDRIQPDRPRLLLLMMGPTRQSLAEVPLADPSFGRRSTMSLLSAPFPLCCRV